VTQLKAAHTRAVCSYCDRIAPRQHYIGTHLERENLQIVSQQL